LFLSLFAALREFDAQGVTLIWIETSPACNGPPEAKQRAGAFARLAPACGKSPESGKRWLF
jgi:hypothetical protein